MKSAEVDTSGAGDNAVLDNLLEKLRNGDSVGRKSRKNRRPNGKAATPLRIKVDGKDTVKPGIEAALPAEGDKTIDLARDMLAALKSDGFEAFTPTSASRPERSTRRTRRRRVTEFGTEESISSPTSDVREELGVEDEGEMAGGRLESGADSDGEDGIAPMYEDGEDGDATITER
ncbi:hypothetical protein DFH11DRAFT_1096683 [Phellopilus nigrolimitatus]|nr:hypothetical protein DFH11DRAFT_1096683 [Phellopilus nigrolimitatus]